MTRMKTLMMSMMALAVFCAMLPAAEAQFAPQVFKGVDGRQSTYQMACVGDCQAYMHVMIFTSAGRRVISFVQTAVSSNGVESVWGNPTVWPVLTDADGVITSIDVIGYIRWHSRPDRVYGFASHTQASEINLTEHETNLAGVADTLETGQVFIYFNFTAPEPGAGS